MILALALDEASAKLRSGGPLDDEADYAVPVWAGHLPLALSPGAPVADECLFPGVAVPVSLSAYRRPRSASDR